MSDTEASHSDKKAYLLGWFVATCVIAIFSAFIYKAPHGEHVGFGMRLLGMLLSIPTGFVGALVGDLLRRFAIPDLVLTTGGFFQLLKTRMFWMVGPQLIGMFIGICFVLGNIL